MRAPGNPWEQSPANGRGPRAARGQQRRSNGRPRGMEASPVAWSLLARVRAVDGEDLEVQLAGGRVDDGQVAGAASEQRLPERRADGDLVREGIRLQRSDQLVLDDLAVARSRRRTCSPRSTTPLWESGSASWAEAMRSWRSEIRCSRRACSPRASWYSGVSVPLRSATSPSASCSAISCRRTVVRCSSSSTSRARPLKVIRVSGTSPPSTIGAPRPLTSELAALRPQLACPPRLAVSGRETISPPSAAPR